MQKKSGSNWRLAVILSLAGLAILGATCGGGCLLFVGGIFAATQAPADEAKAFLRDVREDDIQGAYGRMSPVYRDEKDITQFQADLATIPELATHTDDTVVGRHIQNSTATMTINLDAPSGDASIIVELVKRHGQWYVTSVHRS